jgi:predicted permease
VAWLHRLLRRSHVERELDKELAYHLERRVAELVDAGVGAREAARLARLEFGGVEAVREACRDARGTRWVEDFLHDSRHAVRVLWRSPVFTCMAVVSLALGIGANTAIFSLMDRVQFRMMPVRNPEQLVQITRFRPPYGLASISYPLYETFSERLRSFDGLLAQHSLGVLDITIGSEPESADIDLVSGSYYTLLGVNAAVGRIFVDDVDGAPGAHPVAVIGHRYWERRFASDPAIVGMTFRRLDTVFTIIGVTPPAFFGTVVGREPDITVPLSMDAQVRGGESWLGFSSRSWLSVLGRLKPGVGLVQADSEVSTLFAGVIAEDVAAAASDTERRGRLSEYVEVRPAGNGFDTLRRRFSEPLIILSTIAALALLLACANLANLLLARSSARQREIAVRLAVGAGRGRVVRQLLAEGWVLAVAGGSIGVILAYTFAESLITMMSNGGPRILLDVSPEPRMLFFAMATSFVACLLFSLTPALQATRGRVDAALAGVGVGIRWRMGKILVVTQMAISALLLIGAGLFVRTLINMYTLEAGFDRHGVVLFSTNARRLGFDRHRFQELHTRLPAELRALPGIQSASVSMFLPLRGGWDASFVVEGHTPQVAENDLSFVNSIGPDFFRTFRTSIVMGREFNERDTANAARVAIVNETFARYYFQNRNPVGRWVAFQGPERDTHYEIVGVVKDVRYRGLRGDPPRMVYVAATQVPPGPDSYMFAARTSVGVGAATMAIRTALSRIDRALQPTSVMTLEDHVDRSILQERMLATLAGYFGAVSLLLSAVGVYGLMAFQVMRRQREIGVRMALGANAGSVLAMVLGETSRLTLIGCALGAIAALALTQSTEHVLFGIAPHDPLTFGAAIACLLFVALGAAYAPAHMAARTNPVEVLRLD